MYHRVLSERTESSSKWSRQLRSKELAVAEAFRHSNLRWKEKGCVGVRIVGKDRGNIYYVEHSVDSHAWWGKHASISSSLSVFRYFKSYRQ